jgi:MraZ protein
MGQQECRREKNIRSVEQMFLGAFEHTIDDKGRLTIPAKFRARLAGGLVVTKGIDSSPCLWLYPVDGWDHLAQKVSALPQADPRAQELRRDLFGVASDAVPDGQGRVMLPLNLREHANIDRQVVIVGLYDHCEIWNLERWRERQEKSDSDPVARAQQFASLGI